MEEEGEGKIHNFYVSFTFHVKLCFKRHVHWWDGWKKEGNSVEKENPTKEKDVGILICSPLELALAFTIQTVNGQKLLGEKEDTFSQPEYIRTHQPDWMDLDDSINMDNEQPKIEGSCVKEVNKSLQREENIVDSWNNILKKFFYVNREEAILTTAIKEERLQSIIGIGLVVAIFDEYKFNQLLRSSIISHVKYSIVGSSMPKNVQPFVVGYRFGSMAAHNGQLNHDDIFGGVHQVKSSHCMPYDDVFSNIGEFPKSRSAKHCHSLQNKGYYQSWLPSPTPSEDNEEEEASNQGLEVSSYAASTLPKQVTEESEMRPTGFDGNLSFLSAKDCSAPLNSDVESRDVKPRTQTWSTVNLQPPVFQPKDSRDAVELRRLINLTAVISRKALAKSRDPRRRVK
ncbi:hypothetical protein SUGI_0027430 [Cryptomeria japonica]|nr:hypothetical protein SUGI_0027430 [Cryptomeria japonica]